MKSTRKSKAKPSDSFNTEELDDLVDDESESSSPEPPPKRGRRSRKASKRPRPASKPKRTVPAKKRKLKAKKQSSDDGGGYARAEITSEQLENLAHDMEGSKRPETERKYDSQYARYLWHCEHLEDGSARDPPYNPDMSLPDGQAKITSFMMWVGENYPGWEAPNKAKQIGLGTVKQARGMVKLYWALHHLKAGLSAGDMGGAYTSAASGAEAKSLPDKGARPDRDPQIGTVDDTLSPDQLFQLCLTMLGSDKPTAARDLSMALWLTMTIGRGDDARLVFLPDLLPPEVLRVIGPNPAILLSAVLRGGKRQFGGKVAYAGSIRHKDPLLCAHGALARHLITRFMLEKAPVPNVLDPDEWHHTPLWTGNNPHESISYTQHADSLKAFLEAAGIIITKVTHAFRMYKARDLDEQGVDDGLIARMGRWLRTALNLCYLRFFKPQGLLAAAGWPQDQMDAFFAERFCLTFDDDEEMAELAAELLPVKEAQAMVDKMTRKQLAENPSAGALAIVMDYLGRVGAQDSCGLLCCENEEVREAAAANPSIKFMLEKPRFRRLLAIFKDKLAAGVMSTCAPAAPESA